VYEKTHKSHIRLRIARETKSEVWKIDELLDVIKGCGDCPISLRFVHDRINFHVRGLSWLRSIWKLILIPVVMSKMLPDIRLRIARETMNC